MGGTVVANVLQKDGAHGAPYEKTTGYARSWVGCAVRTRGLNALIIRRMRRVCTSAHCCSPIEYISSVIE